RQDPRREGFDYMRSRHMNMEPLAILPGASLGEVVLAEPAVAGSRLRLDAAPLAVLLPPLSHREPQYVAVPGHAAREVVDGERRRQRAETKRLRPAPLGTRRGNLLLRGAFDPLLAAHRLLLAAGYLPCRAVTGGRNSVASRRRRRQITRRTHVTRGFRCRPVVLPRFGRESSRTGRGPSRRRAARSPGPTPSPPASKASQAPTPRTTPPRPT